MLCRTIPTALCSYWKEKLKLKNKSCEQNENIYFCIISNSTYLLVLFLLYKRNETHHVNRMPRNRLPRVIKQYSPTGRRNHGRPLKRLLDSWDRNGSTSGPTPWKIDDDDDDDDDSFFLFILFLWIIYYLSVVSVYITFVVHKIKFSHHRHLCNYSLKIPSPINICMFLSPYQNSLN